jgi:hypothetical protein
MDETDPVGGAEIFQVRRQQCRARQMPKAEFQRGVEKELTGKDSEPSELIYFKVYKSQIPVIERAIETAALMLGSDKSRGYCLEMICADFLAGTSIDGSNHRSCCNPSPATTSFCPAHNRKLFDLRSPGRPREQNPVQEPATETRFDELWQTATPGACSATAGDASSAVACKTYKYTISNSAATRVATRNRT